MQTIQEQNGELQHQLDKVHLLNEKNEKAKVKIQKLLKNVLASISYAKRIQGATLPTENDIKTLLPDSFIFYQPKDIVGGDFYWLAEVQGKKIIVVGDCTGHGVPGAFMTLIANNILNQIIKYQQVYQASKILTEVPRILHQTFAYKESKMREGMDMAILVIEESPNETIMHYAGAMMPLYLVQNQELKEFKPDKVWIDGRKSDINYEYQEQEIKIESPTMFYLLSDGYQDQFGGENNRKFLRKNLKNLLLSIAEKTMDKQKMALEANFNEWQGNHMQTDDVIVLGLQIS